MGEFQPGRKPDHVVFQFEDADGGLNVAELDLDQAAAMQRGETVSGFGLSTYYSLADRIAIAKANLDGVRARKAEMETEYPELRSI